MSKATKQDIEVGNEQDSVDYKSLYLRAMADIENMRKRQDADRKMIRLSAIESAVEDFLPIVDNFDRAMEHIPIEQSEQAWVVGIAHIQRHFKDALSNLGVREIMAKPGDIFDLSVHEAVGAVENSEFDPDHIVTVVQVGYCLGEHIIRPTKVTVAAAAEK